jgi:hypothetical protein
MAVTHQLSGLIPGVGKTHLVDHIVETHLQQAQKIGPGNAFLPFRDQEIMMELALQDTVHAADLLLLPQLELVIGRFFPLPPVLSGGVGPTLIRAFIGKAPVALEKYLCAFPSA